MTPGPAETGEIARLFLVKEPTMAARLGRAKRKIAAAGITTGCNPPVNDRFCPDNLVTRGEMAAFLSRALNLTGGSGVSFSDIGGSLFADDIKRIAAAGIGALAFTLQWVMDERPPHRRPLPPATPSAAPLGYRPPVREPKSQWLTDDQPGGGWLVVGLLVLSGIVAVGGTILGLLLMISGC